MKRGTQASIFEFSRQKSTVKPNGWILAIFGTKIQMFWKVSDKRFFDETFFNIFEFSLQKSTVKPKGWILAIFGAKIQMFWKLVKKNFDETFFKIFEFSRQKFIFFYINNSDVIELYENGTIYDGHMEKYSKS